MKKNKNIILFGSCGFIASNFISQNKKNYIYSLDVKDFNSKLNKNYSFVKLNLNKTIKIKPFKKKIDVAIITSYNINFKDVEEKKYLKENINIINNALKICKINNVAKIIYISSAAVYGKKNKIIKEKDKLNPLNIYGISKVVTEQMIMDYAKTNNRQFIIFRIFNAYGYSQNNLIYKFIQMSKNNIPIKINGSGSQIRDFIFIDDVISAINKAVISKNNKNLILNLGTGKKILMRKVVKTITNNFIYAKNINEPAKLYGSIVEIKNELKWSPKISFKDGINKILIQNK